VTSLRTVKTGTTYRWLLGAFIALFFAMQSFSLAHASSYGEEHHEHDGIACAVTIVAAEDIAILPSLPDTPAILSETFEADYPDFTSAAYVKPQSRAPPPRGPPASI